VGGCGGGSGWGGCTRASSSSCLRLHAASSCHRIDAASSCRCEDAVAAAVAARAQAGKAGKGKGGELFCSGASEWMHGQRSWRSAALPLELQQSCNPQLQRAAATRSMLLAARSCNQAATELQPSCNAQLQLSQAAGAGGARSPRSSSALCGAAAELQRAVAARQHYDGGGKAA
jgi:hypothetical protein